MMPALPSVKKLTTRVATATQPTGGKQRPLTRSYGRSVV